MKIDVFSQKLHRYWIRQRLKPISVFVFHHVSEVRNPLICAEEDWTSMEVFKNNIVKLQQEFEFISLTNAYRHLSLDKWRKKRYVVLTADDAYRSILDIVPWLAARRIPLVIFANSRFLDQDSMTPIHEEYIKTVAPNADLGQVLKATYMSKEELWSLNDEETIEVGLHGHEHLDLSQLDQDNMVREVETCRSILQSHPRYIPFYAYPWGACNANTDNYLLQHGLIPVKVSGSKNYNNKEYVDRKCVDGMELK
jgi:peptidoglycan/xylan/chitin deacetylase (PgdA/CDA1 family)